MKRESMKKNIMPTCFTVASIVLMILPYGVRMNFVLSPGQTVSSYYSYISNKPIGYANWFPIITFILSIAVAPLLFFEKKKGALICLSICLVASLASWGIFKAISIVGVIVFALHAATLVFQIMQKEPNAKAIN